MTKDAPVQRDLLARVGNDEPIFILRARDALAVKAIIKWIHEAELAGVNDTKMREAMAQLEEFKRWQATHPTRIPD